MKHIELVSNIERATTAHASARMQERMEMLGIPLEEMTPGVSFAVSALLEKVDDLSRELSRTKENLTEIEQLVDVDCVAPIPNRRAFMRRMAWAIAMMERYSHTSTVVYFDINDFKEINDTYGHAAGDLAIRHISQLLTKTIRGSDFIARIGGDEFALIMYHADIHSAKNRGKRFEEMLEKTPFMYNSKPLHISTAVGYYSIKKGDDPESALSAADMSMYVDKRRKKDSIQ